MLQQVKMSNDGVFQYPLLSATIKILVFFNIKSSRFDDQSLTSLNKNFANFLSTS